MITKEQFRELLSLIKANREKGFKVLYSGDDIIRSDEKDRTFTTRARNIHGVPVSYRLEDFPMISITTLYERFNVVKTEPLRQ